MTDAPADLRIELPAGRTAFRPGATLTGVVSWRLPVALDSLELRLFWFTRGKGTEDVSVVAHREYASPGLSGRREFSFKLPESPYSFSGRLVSLTWALELVTPRGKQSARVEFVLSPFDHEILLGEPAPDDSAEATL
jgi:hypothetical protein